MNYKTGVQTAGEPFPLILSYLISNSFFKFLIIMKITYMYIKE